MREVGTVVASGDGRARVRVASSHACTQCGRCGLQVRGETTIVEAVDGLESRVGDLVEIEMGSGDLLKAAATLYLVPLALAAVGYLAGRWATGAADRLADVGGLVGGLISFGFSFSWLRHFDRRAQLSGRYLPVILRKIEGSEGA